MVTPSTAPERVKVREFARFILSLTGDNTTTRFSYASQGDGCEGGLSGLRAAEGSNALGNLCGGRRAGEAGSHSTRVGTHPHSTTVSLLTLTLSNREYDITKRRVQKIIKAGATVVLTTGGIDDFTLKEFVESGVMAVRRVKKEDLKRIARATGGEYEFDFIHSSQS